MLAVLEGDACLRASVTADGAALPISLFKQKAHSDRLGCVLEKIGLEKPASQGEIMPISVSELSFWSVKWV